jgi:hypothetical protein
MMAVYAETCSSTEDYEQVCRSESERIINKKLSTYNLRHICYARVGLFICYSEVDTCKNRVTFDIRNLSNFK